MADLEVLRLGVQALFPSTINPLFVRVPDKSVPPWTAISIALPSPSTRAMNTRILSKRVLVRCRVVAANDEAVWQLGQMLTDAVEGVRVVAEGWAPAPLQQLNDNPMPYEDTDMTLAVTNAHPVVLPFDFDFYATTKETP